MGRRNRHLHKTTKQWTGSACLLLAGALLVPQVANAETVWQPPDSTSHDWFTGSNWSGGTIPQADDDVVVDDPTYAAYATQTSSIASLRLETDETSEAKVVQTSGKLTISKVDTTDEYGTLTINDDTYSIPLSNDLLLATGDALYQLQGGTLVKSGYEVKIGTSGYGQFEQSGGEFQFSGAMYLGDQGTGLGKYTMTNGRLVAGPGGRGGIVLGEWGRTGIFIQSGGTVEIADLTLARQAFPVAASGYYALSEADHDNAPSSLNVSGPEYIGAVGRGVFKHTGGQHTVDTLVVGSSRPEVVLNETNAG